MQVTFLTMRQSNDSLNKITQVIENETKNEEEAVSIENSFNKAYVNKALSLAEYLNAPGAQKPNNTEAKTLAKGYIVEDLYALDSSRNVLATSSDNPLDFTISKFDDCFISEGAYVTYDNIRYYSVSYSGGYVVLAKSSSELTTSLSYIRSLTYLLSSVEVGDGGYIFAVNKDTGKVLYYPISSLVGNNVADIGLSDSVLNDGYKGWVSLKNEDGTTSQYYCISKQSGNYLFYIAAVPRSALTKMFLKL
jgi:moderate conductance mechanosensitive channel